MGQILSNLREKGVSSSKIIQVSKRCLDHQLFSKFQTIKSLELFLQVVLSAFSPIIIILGQFEFSLIGSAS